jgi:hypothetical protein
MLMWSGTLCVALAACSKGDGKAGRNAAGQNVAADPWVAPAGKPSAPSSPPLPARHGTAAGSIAANFQLATACKAGDQGACTELHTSCDIAFNEDVTHLGQTEQALQAALGPPGKIWPWKSKDDDLFHLLVPRALWYGEQPTDGPDGVAIYDFKYYYVNTSGTVVSYMERISNTLSALPKVNDIFPWSSSATWEITTSRPTELWLPVEAVFACGDKVIDIGAYCEPTRGTESGGAAHSYQVVTVTPTNIAQCRFRQFWVSDVLSVQANPTGKFHRYNFPKNATDVDTVTIKPKQ